MNTKVILGLVLCACVSGGAWAKDAEKKQKKKEKHAEKKFEEIDTNKDGSISKDEFLAFQKEHVKHDKKKKD